MPCAVIKLPVIVIAFGGGCLRSLERLICKEIVSIKKHIFLVARGNGLHHLAAVLVKLKGDEGVVDLQLRVDGDVGLIDDDCESRLSKLVPYGLLSSSFHMAMVMSGLLRQSRQLQRKECLLEAVKVFRAVKLEPGV